MDSIFEVYILNGSSATVDSLIGLQIGIEGVETQVCIWTCVAASNATTEVCVLDWIELRKSRGLYSGMLRSCPHCKLLPTGRDAITCGLTVLQSCESYQSSSTSSALAVSNLSHTVISFLVLRTLAMDSACLIPMVRPINSNRVMIQARIPGARESMTAGTYNGHSKVAPAVAFGARDEYKEEDVAPKIKGTLAQIS